jgi:hypothetical protein
MLLLALGTFWAVTIACVVVGLTRAASRGDHELVAAGVMNAPPASERPAPQAEHLVRRAA